MNIGIHITHEAIQKIGGIGTVIEGLFAAKSYKKAFPESLLYTPLFNGSGDAQAKLGKNSELLYSGVDHIDVGGWHKVFAPIEEKYGVKIVYGKKRFFDEKSGKEDARVDIVAVDVWKMRDEAVRNFKYRPWEFFEIQSDAFQHDGDYEQYLRIAIPFGEIAEAIYGAKNRAVIFSHEYMGMPCALAAIIARLSGKRKDDVTIFYAHEVSTARMIVEKHPGHDLTFYNVLKSDLDDGISMEERFGSHANYSRNELIKRASLLDYIFAVSDMTRDEYIYLCPKADKSKIKVVYNGIQHETMPFGEKERSFKLISDYCENLFNFTPNYILTHVTRLVASKALWRDTRMLYFIDELFAKAGIKGFFVILSTLLGDARSKESVVRMEADYGWPVMHRKGFPDLVGNEEDIHDQLLLFNCRSRAIKGVFINQFGFSHDACGTRVPKGTILLDLRLASDFEFGMSIYEPFGIAPLETLAYGGIPVVSDCSGCRFLLDSSLTKNDFVTADFTSVPQNYARHLRDAADFMNVGKDLRDLIETESCKKNAAKVFAMLPKNTRSRKLRFESMQKASKKLDWEHVADRIVGYLKETK